MVKAYILSYSDHGTPWNEPVIIHRVQHKASKACV